MITKTIQINDITFEELADKVADKLLVRIEVLLHKLNKSENDILLTSTETAEYLKISLSTLWEWTQYGYLKSYKIANKTFYKKLEIIEY